MSDAKVTDELSESAVQSFTLRSEDEDSQEIGCIVGLLDYVTHKWHLNRKIMRES